MIKKQKANVYLINYVCDDCGKGNLVSRGVMLSRSGHITYVHECTTCGVIRTMEKKFPAREYIAEEEDNVGDE